MPGWVFRMRDNLALQRGVTYTILPDGKRMRVPAMHRLDVRAASQVHSANEGIDIMQALQSILKGKKTLPGQPHFNRRGQVHRRVPAQREHVRGGDAPVGIEPGEGVRQAALVAGVAEV